MIINSNLAELDALLRLLKKYSKLGVTKLHAFGYTIELSPHEQIEKTHRPKGNATPKALATKPDGVDDDMTEDEEFEMSQLRINDPEAFEELEIKRMKGDGR